MAQEKEIESWITIKHMHVPIYKGETAEDAVNRFKERTQGIRKTGSSSEPKQKDPEAIAQRFANNLSKQGISNEWEIEGWLLSKSSGYRNSLAKDIGIAGKGDDRVKALAHKLFITGKNGGVEIKTEPPEPVEIKTEPPKPTEPEYERTPKMDWIDKRIEGKQKELEKAEKKMERIQKAKASDYKENNPYYYSDYDLRSTQKDIDNAKEALEDYKKQMEKEIEKAKSRNVPVITEFLDDWEKKSIEYFIKEKELYNEAYEKYKKRDKEYIDFFNYPHRTIPDFDRNNPEHKELYRKKWAEHDEYRKFFKAQWRYITQFNDGQGTWEENMKKAVAREKVAKYDDIITRTNDLIGQITDAGALHIGKKGDLNGVIVGTKGKATVETIGAGGYNIQRYHFRTLINKLKEKK